MHRNMAANRIGPSPRKPTVAPVSLAQFQAQSLACNWVASEIALPRYPEIRHFFAIHEASGNFLCWFRPADRSPSRPAESTLSVPRILPLDGANVAPSQARGCDANHAVDQRIMPHRKAGLTSNFGSFGRRRWRSADDPCAGTTDHQSRCPDPDIGKDAYPTKVPARFVSAENQLDGRGNHIAATKPDQPC